MSALVQRPFGLRSVVMLVLAVLTALAIALPAAWVPAARAAAATDPRVPLPPAANADPHAPPPEPVRAPVALEMGTGRVITLPAPAANVFEADPKVAEVRPASANTLFVFGVGPGRTTVAAMDAAGQVLAQFSVSVTRSDFAAHEAEAAISRLMPGRHISVTAQQRGLLLSGRVENPAEAARAASIAKGYLADGLVVENQITAAAMVQVALRVRIAEMSRTVSRALGVNWQALGTIGRSGVFGAGSAGQATFDAATSYALSPLSIASMGTATIGFADANATIDALAQDNLAHVLAEPNLTTMSGEPASFLVGGEFPIPVAQSNNQISVEFKKYGVTLAFVPTVLADGRINLHVSPEVSQLTTNGAVTLSASNSSISVPALQVRRAETTVELGSGQSFAIAGLLQDSGIQNANGLPGIGDVPILGALFRSHAFQRNESELVILVTPYIVRPVDNPQTLRGPTDGIQPTNDFERILLLRQIKPADADGIGRGRPLAIAAPTRVPGQAGFIVQ